MTSHLVGRPQVDDVIELLNTNDGVYAAACSLDYSRPPLYYDTFALRDSHGDEHLMQTWPYFRSTTSRHALFNMSPVPVKSCWNGMGRLIFPPPQHHSMLVVYLFLWFNSPA
jgi:hypothetical protein